MMDDLDWLIFSFEQDNISDFFFFQNRLYKKKPPENDINFVYCKFLKQNSKERIVISSEPDK